MSTPTQAIHFAQFASPIGRIEVTSNGSQITSLSIENQGALPHDGAPSSPDALTESAQAQLTEYFAGTRKDFDVPVALPGTKFQQQIWRELNDIPFGEVASYGELGERTGRATAGRAVGGAVGANPVPILVACHRVLATNKKITGYSAGNGIETKAWLLDHEGIEHK